MSILRRGLLLLPLLVAGFTTAGPARAEVGDRGAIILSADRLFGFSHSKMTLDAPPPLGQRSVSQTDFTLFAAAQPATPFMLPRLAIDFGVIEGLTVGTAVGVGITGNSSTATTFGMTVTTEGDDESLLILAPRIGYALPLGNRVRLWIRAGVSYFQAATDDQGNDDARWQQFAFTIEPTLVFMLGSQVGLTVGGVFDLPFSGDVRETEGPNPQSFELNARHLGAMVGLALAL